MNSSILHSRVENCTLVPEVFLIFHRFSRSCERAAKRRTRVAKRRERKTSGYFGLESHFHADASSQTRQFDNSKKGTMEA